MSRPMSMPDFSALLDASTPLHSRREIPRKKPSISLAAGLIMATTDSPKSLPNTPQQGKVGKIGEEWSHNLFYAYAGTVDGGGRGEGAGRANGWWADYAKSPPYTLTFASASICERWWSLVQREYPESTRTGPQLFILKGDDVQEQIQNNPRFFDLRNKWFYTESTAVIPLQDYKGHLVTAAPGPAPKEEKEEAFNMAALTTALDRMNSMINENSAQIRALSVAQSEGLRRMQEINESNAGQIKALADSQAKLQSIVDQNASHYIALSNSSFKNQEQVKSGVGRANEGWWREVKSALQSNAGQIEALADGQMQLSRTCEGMIRSIESLGHTVGRVSDTMSSALSDTASNGSSFSTVASQILPPPRKLNRKIKGVWYEYDNSPASSPRKSVLDTPPKSPLSNRRV
ncbi:hypothetical protein K458DRAFT_318196 [Lentithecium fluviatile CBS 122367]|uniref:Uncharacterized protein n=1 Tax=Lentithecium fluviatile CBS 122367 TaxID=1168545 RepID=A0A6G1IIP0_9PLEO|nr:hypothetical protein K458DRAFT_318196 [Lentithecium fluviatile CBS 122367]